MVVRHIVHVTCSHELPDRETRPGTVEFIPKSRISDSSKFNELQDNFLLQNPQLGVLNGLRNNTTTRTSETLRETVFTIAPPRTLMYGFL